MAQRPVIGRPGQFDQFRRECIQRLERASLIATDRAARGAQTGIRAAMAGAALGKLGNAIGYGSDLKRGRGVKRFGDGGFRCSGWVFIKGRSERTVGAVISYTEGSEIAPVRARWLWIAVPELQRVVGKGKGKQRLTPATYNSMGLDKKIGPLIFVMGRHSGEALLIVKRVTFDRFGRGGAKHGPRAVPRRGGIGGSRQLATNAVMFVGIKRTARSARLSPREILSEQQAALGFYRSEAMGKG
jgi:hypothetical protein